MSMFSKKSKKATESSEFSVFIREARSSTKKRVYKRVINEAIESQARVIRSAGTGGLIMATKREPEVRRKLLARQRLKRARVVKEVDTIVALEDGGRNSMAKMQLWTKSKHQAKTTRENRARARKK